MNKIIKSLLLLSFTFLFVGSIKAEECSITNNEGVEIPCDFYEALREYYSDNFLSFMTQNEYDQIKNNDIDDIEVITYNEENPFISGRENGRGTYFETAYKQLRITRNGNFINANLLWVQNPVTRSYDVFGIRFYGPTIIGTPLFREYYEREMKSREILISLLPKNYYYKKFITKKEIQMIKNEIED